MIISKIEEIPQSDIGLILGTPKYLPGGKPNIYYHNRIKATCDLYKIHKVNKILISADTLNKYSENEVEFIKNDLLQNGIPDTDLMYDRMGNHTLNSILSLRRFNRKEIVVVSQKFHLERALYLAQKLKISASGYISEGTLTNRLIIRELFGRFKMRIDIILN
jgi:SanA protein